MHFISNFKITGYLKGDCLTTKWSWQWMVFYKYFNDCVYELHSNESNENIWLQDDEQIENVFVIY